MTAKTAQQKATLRKTAFAARKAAFEARVYTDAVARATKLLLSVIGSPAGHCISGYMPIRTEMDALPAMTALFQARAQIGVPVIAGKGLPLTFHTWTPEVDLIEGPFGARVPAQGDVLVPDTLIVPLVGFDANGQRLGYGGGFYDRTLAVLRARGPVRAIGFAFAAQHLPPLPTEPTDQPLDMIVTEDGVLRP